MIDPSTTTRRHPTMWSRKFSCCQKCGSTERRHYGHGLCCVCFKQWRKTVVPEVYHAINLRRYAKHRERLKEDSMVWYYENRVEALAYRKRWRNLRHFDGKWEEVLKRDGYKCKICGEPAQLVHHKDGSGKLSRIGGKANNADENLDSLCRSCHCILHKPRAETGRNKI